jgi:4-hydroxy-tetrahydrodipicolinate synthase
MFRGSIVALVTPFKPNFDVDFDAFGRLIDRQIEAGTHGIVPCGCTGEAATMTHDEQKKIVKYCVERVAGRVPVIAGAGSNNTKEAIELTRFAKEVGADGALSITPYYNKPMPAGQIAHYTAIAEAAKLPIMLYNVPGRTGTRMTPETIAALSKVDYIESVKEASGSIEQVTEILSQCDINVLSGDDSMTLPMMAIGARGVVSVAANVIPETVAALCDTFDEGNLADARTIHYEMVAMNKALFVETNPIPVKAMLAEMGLIENVLRMPLTPLGPAGKEAIKKVLQTVAPV